MKESEFSEFQCKIKALNSKYKGLNRFSQLILQILYEFCTVGFYLILNFMFNFLENPFVVGDTKNMNENFERGCC
ncbi:hypothetical protein CQ046_05750 [Chryseobacterium sp. MYb7]|nr:hypothetical protein CQ046_05750 [Chryseobacterium sp. MYb7]